MTKVHYYTARCILGCEAWLHPKAVKPHTEEPERCKRMPWIDLLQDEALIAAPLAEVISILMPDGIITDPQFSEDRYLGRNGELHPDLAHGIVIRSPLDGVAAQRWAAVVTIAEGEIGIGVVERAFDPEGFNQIEANLNHRQRLVTCSACRAVTTPRGLNGHRASNTACRWRRSAAEVRQLWELGWRDPYSLRSVPDTWTELSTPSWRPRVHVVPFRSWTAVLVREERIP